MTSLYEVHRRSTCSGFEVMLLNFLTFERAVEIRDDLRKRGSHNGLYQYGIEKQIKRKKAI